MDTQVATYLTRFRAQVPEDLPDNAADRLREALEGVPGPVAAHGATHDHDAGTVTGEFLLQVEQGISAAARDGSRLAREALKSAGFGDAPLVELCISLRGEAVA